MVAAARAGASVRSIRGALVLAPVPFIIGFGELGIDPWLSWIGMTARVHPHPLGLREGFRILC
jgi:hypothetical protein